MSECMERERERLQDDWTARGPDFQLIVPQQIYRYRDVECMSEVATLCFRPWLRVPFPFDPLLFGERWYLPWL